jgi:hypothetical protein
MTDPEYMKILHTCVRYRLYFVIRLFYDTLSLILFVWRPSCRPQDRLIWIRLPVGRGNCCALQRVQPLAPSYILLNGYHGLLLGLSEASHFHLERRLKFVNPYGQFSKQRKVCNGLAPSRVGCYFHLSLSRFLLRSYYTSVGAHPLDYPMDCGFDSTVWCSLSVFGVTKVDFSAATSASSFSPITVPFF